MISAENSPDVYSGDDSTTLVFGGAKKFIAGASVFNRLGSYIYDYAIIAKQAETWLLNGYSVSGEGAFTKKRLSNTIGCCSPESMAVCDSGYSMDERLRTNSVSILWLSYSGVVAFSEGRLRLIKGIDPYFEPQNALFVGYTNLESAFGFFDLINNEYNLIVGSLWFIYDLKRDRWTKKSVPLYPVCAFDAVDTDGARYNYLGTSTGYLLRNEHTNNFDGTAISQIVQFSDLLPTDSIWEDIRIDFLKFICKAKNTGTAVSITAYHRSNADEAWTAVTSIPMYASSKRIVKHTQRLNKLGIGHEFKFVASTNDKIDGCEPLGIGLLYHPERINTAAGV